MTDSFTFSTSPRPPCTGQGGRARKWPIAPIEAIFEPSWPALSRVWRWIGGFEQRVAGSRQNQTTPLRHHVLFAQRRMSSGSLMLDDQFTEKSGNSSSLGIASPSSTRRLPSPRSSSISACRGFGATGNHTPTRSVEMAHFRLPRAKPAEHREAPRSQRRRADRAVAGGRCPLPRVPGA